MKKHTHFFTVTGLIALMFSTPAFGQYQSFFGEKTTKYSICMMPTISNGENDTITPDYRLLGCETQEYYLMSKGDTIMVNDTIYYCFGCSSAYPYPSRYGLNIREDTSTGQIFRYFEKNKKEYLICDMSLNVRDTFTLPDFEISDFYWERGENIIVDSIDYINGKKIIYFSSIEESAYYNSMALYPPPGHILYDYGKLYHLTFMEGVGPIYGPFGYVTYGEWYLGVMLCVEKDDTLTYMTSPYLGCIQFGWSSIVEGNVNPIRVYPNPAADNIHIEIDNEALLHGTLRIIDPIGQVVLTRTLTSNKETISVKHLSAGIYIIHYNFNNQIFHSKIVKY